MSIIEGRNAEILQSIIDGTPYENPNPYPSRIEQLLMELKEAIEEGGGTTVDQTYSPTSENAQSGKAVAEALETIPSVTVDQTFDAASANAQSGVAVQQALQTIPTVTVDQTFNASSANAQSGVAVQQALQSIPIPQLHKIVDFMEFQSGSQDGTTLNATLAEDLTLNKLYFLRIKMPSGNLFIPIHLYESNSPNPYYVPCFNITTGAFIASISVFEMSATSVRFILKTSAAISNSIQVAIYSYP